MQDSETMHSATKPFFGFHFSIDLKISVEFIISSSFMPDESETVPLGGDVMELISSKFYELRHKKKIVLGVADQF